MFLEFFAARGWEEWDLAFRPALPDGMPVLIDDDLLFEDGPGQPRPTVVVNQWLRQLPSSGGPSPRTWAVYARIVRDWMVFLAERGIRLFDSRERLRSGLSGYAAYRAVGPLTARFEASTWNQHVTVLASFYRWAEAGGHAESQPFTYRTAVTYFTDQVKVQQVNQAVRRTPKAHVTIKYLEREFADLFVNGLRGLTPDGAEDPTFRGWELARNGAVGELALATGLRMQEFSNLLVHEIPALPPQRTELPIPFPVPEGVTKGRKFRTTWISYDALAAVHRYIELDRAMAVEGSSWRPAEKQGGALVVSEADARGGRIDGDKVAWPSIRPAERRRLVSAGGGSLLLAVRSDGGPFTAWNTVFERTSARIKKRFEPRFPHVWPHRLRHTFAIQTIERLVSGYYVEVAKTELATRGDDALALYLTKADPLMVLRDLLGHSSVMTTEAYLRRLDMTRVYRDAYERATAEVGQAADAAADREAADEFTDDEEEL